VLTLELGFVPESLKCAAHGATLLTGRGELLHLYLALLGWPSR
jgi:hypothetical protein